MAPHPAKFSEPVLEKVVDMLDDWGWPARILDPFAGTGRVHRLGQGRDNVETVGIEIEPEWASMTPGTVVGNALQLPFPDGSFDGLVSSPSYGNRLADHHNAQDGSRRYSYRHVLGRELHEDNSGRMQWGERYRAVHRAAWNECLRVLRPDSLIIINSSNHVRGGKEQFVTEFHLQHFLNHGCAVLDLDVVNTRRLKHGANRDVRPRYENVFALRYVAPVYTPDQPDEEEEDLYERVDARRGTGVAGTMDTGEGGQRP